MPTFIHYQSLFFISNLLQLAHRSLLSRLSNDSYSIDSRLFRIVFGIDHKHYKTGNVLKLDISRLDHGCLGLFIPIFWLEFNDLRCRDIVCFVKALCR
jgi:hypothetical protein